MKRKNKIESIIYNSNTKGHTLSIRSTYSKHTI